VKSVWVLSREVAGSLRLQGHRLDGLGELEFQRGTDGDIVRALDIADPWHDSMRPGGPSIMQRYSLVATYVYYPSAGCWELIARLGGREVRIVTLLKNGSGSSFGAVCSVRPCRSRPDIGRYVSQSFSTAAHRSRS
jgi:hypothetical protein